MDLAAAMLEAHRAWQMLNQTLEEVFDSISPGWDERVNVHSSRVVVDDVRVSFHDPDVWLVVDGFLSDLEVAQLEEHGFCVMVKDE